MTLQGLSLDDFELDTNGPAKGPLDSIDLSGDAVADDAADIPLAAVAAAVAVCVACGGTGIASDGSRCYPCSVNGQSSVAIREQQKSDMGLHDPAPVVRPRRTSLATAGELLFLDIETIPDFSRLDLFDLPPVTEYQETPADQLPSPAEFVTQDLPAAKQSLAGKFPAADWLNATEAAENATKKPRKGMLDLIAGLRSAKRECEAAAADRNKLLSVTPEYCKIIAVGFHTINPTDQPISYVVSDIGPHGRAMDEQYLLELIWEELASGCKVCGFGVLHFDLPTILTRSAMLGVLPSRRLNLSPWSNPDVLDLNVARFGTHGQRGMNLKHLCRLFGIVPPAGDVDGSMVLEMWQRSEIREIGQYVESDVVVEAELYRALSGYFW